MLRYIHILVVLFAVIFAGCKRSESKGSEATELSSQLSICFTGDVLLDRGVRTQIEKKGVEHLFSGVKDIFESADATVINLECPVTDIVAPINKRFIFRADTQWLPSLKASGITHAALANNHSMDQGRKGLTDTYDNLLAAGIQPIGYGNTRKSACQPIFISKDSIEVAIFNMTILPLENWVTLDDSPNICQASPEEVAENIKAVKTNNPDCHILVVVHWGTEYQQTPSISQRKATYILLNAGAEAIIGHHPHIIQKEEIYEGKPIFYSIGNFVFDQHMPLTDEGLIIKANFTESTSRYDKIRVKIKNCRPEIQ